MKYFIHIQGREQCSRLVYDYNINVNNISERRAVMQKITRKFVTNTSIDINKDVIKVFEFIASPDSVQKMITSTDNGKPALAGIVHDLVML